MVRLVLLIALSWFTFGVVLIPIRIVGISMLPTYKNGSVNFVNRWAFLWKPIRRSDVVAVRYSGLHAMLLKRVVGLPGERIAIRKGIVYINGEELMEPYVKLPREPWYRREVTLRPFEYYVVGDNRSMPLNQHEQGEASAERIVGKILF